MNYCSSVLLFSTDKEAVCRLNQVLDWERGVFSLLCEAPCIWHMEGRDVDFLGLITLINTNVWRGPIQMLRKDEDSALFSPVLGLHPMRVQPCMVWSQDDTGWEMGEFVTNIPS